LPLEEEGKKEVGVLGLVNPAEGQGHAFQKDAPVTNEFREELFFGRGKVNAKVNLNGG